MYLFDVFVCLKVPMSRAPVGWPGNAAHGGTKGPSMSGGGRRGRKWRAGGVGMGGMGVW